MSLNDEVRNEYKQQLKDKIDTVQNSNDGYRQKWKVYVIVRRDVQNQTWKNTVQPKQPISLWNDIT